MVFPSFSNAQDIIYKKNGDSLIVNVKEKDSLKVFYTEYLKSDGKLLNEKIENIKVIYYADGRVENVAENLSLKEKIQLKQDIANSLVYGPDSHQILHIKKNEYKIDNEEVKLKDVNSLLMRSLRPDVKSALKGARGLRIVEQIFSFTSIATTSTGFVGSMAIIHNIVNKVRAGTIKPADWWGMGFSFFGTMAFPITGKILKHFERKRYDKVIDIYNVKEDVGYFRF
jgi:hypothetical protein